MKIALKTLSLALFVAGTAQINAMQAPTDGTVQIDMLQSFLDRGLIDANLYTRDTLAPAALPFISPYLGHSYCFLRAYKRDGGRVALRYATKETATAGMLAALKYAAKEATGKDDLFSCPPEKESLLENLKSGCYACEFARFFLRDVVPTAIIQANIIKPALDKTFGPSDSPYA